MKKPQLFLIHFAGGNRYSFQFMMPLLLAFEVISLELPGRGKRMNEPLLDDFDAAAKDLYKEVITQLTASEFLIYGHSMGAYLALRVTNMLEETGRYPIRIIVSGNAGPRKQASDKKLRYLLARQDFIEELTTLGGLPPELIENKDLFNFFEPASNYLFNGSVVNILTRIFNHS